MLIIQPNSFVVAINIGSGGSSSIGRDRTVSRGGIRVRTIRDSFQPDWVSYRVLGHLKSVLGRYSLAIGARLFEILRALITLMVVHPDLYRNILSVVF